MTSPALAFALPDRYLVVDEGEGFFNQGHRYLTVTLTDQLPCRQRPNAVLLKLPLGDTGFLEHPLHNRQGLGRELFALNHARVYPYSELTQLALDCGQN